MDACVITEDTELLLSVKLEKSGEKGNGVLRVEVPRRSFVEELLCG